MLGITLRLNRGYMVFGVLSVNMITGTQARARARARARAVRAL